MVGHILVIEPLPRLLRTVQQRALKTMHRAKNLSALTFSAIYEGAEDWRYQDGTSLKGEVVLTDGKAVNAEVFQAPVSDEYYYIVPDKCTECKGFHEEPQCAAVCPVDCCVPDENHVESEEVLLGKQRFMHPED
jgi:ferredoxin